MRHDIFTASTPDKAYFKAKEKYGFLFKVVNARQIPIKNSDSVICEIVISVDDKLYEEKNKASVKSKDQKKAEEETIQEKLIVKSIVDIFKNREIDKHWVDKKISKLKDKSLKQDKQKLLSYLLNQIHHSIQVSKESLKNKKIIMLVGPTGAGKTTTIAKLAARYSYMLDRTYKVALLNLDNYKVGAKEQLANYAEIMGLQHLIVNGVEDFKNKLEQLEEFDVVLVDTTGISPFDIDKMMKNIKYISASTKHKIYINLVLPATIKYEDFNDMYNSFSFLNIDGLILSKLDETRYFGSIINFLIQDNISPLAYVSVGQEVPDDLIVASREYILDKLAEKIEIG